MRDMNSVAFRISVIILAVVLSGACAVTVHAKEAVDGDANVQQAIWDYQHENYEEALSSLKELRKKYPTSTLVAYYLGITYKQMQDYSRSRKPLEDAVTMQPRIKNALVELIDVLYRKGSLDEAMKWIKVAEEENIHPAQVSFLKGLVLLKRGDDPEAAIEAFMRAKELDGSLTKTADYYIGMAYIRAEKLPQAKKMFREIVTTGPNTSLAAFADQYIDAIERKEEALRPFRGHVGVACQYDDNVILKPDATTLAADIGDQGDWRQVYTFNGEYNARPWDDIGLKAGYSLYLAKQNDLGFYDMVNHNFYGQPGLYLERAAVTFPVGYNYITVNDKHYLNTAQAGNLNNFRVGDDQMLQFSFLYKWEDYIWEPSGPDENRDSNEYEGMLGWYYFFADRKGIVQLRYTLNYDDTRGDNWRYYGNRFTAGATVPVMENVRLGGSVDLFVQQFVKCHSVYDKKRDDTVLTVSAFATWEMFKGMELLLNYTFVNDVCNLSVYAYKRNVYSVGVRYRF